eukprot:scaffold107444_cov28-Tisochrysis_lutea.AAC.4
MLAYKVDTDSADVRLGVGVVSKAQQQTRLAHARVSDQHQLEDVVVLSGLQAHREKEKEGEE